MRMPKLIGTSLLVIACLGCLPAMNAADQADADAAAKERQIPELGTAASEAGRSGHTVSEICLSIGVLVFGALLMGLEVLVMLKQNKYWDAWSFKILGLTLVITAGLFLVVAGYSQNQIAPMMGLLGTVAGYLLGQGMGIFNAVTAIAGVLGAVLGGWAAGVWGYNSIVFLALLGVAVGLGLSFLVNKKAL